MAQERKTVGKGHDGTNKAVAVSNTVVEAVGVTAPVRADVET